MSAFFGVPGPLELLIVGLLCFGLSVVPAIVIVVLLILLKRQNGQAAKQGSSPFSDKPEASRD
jgi:hypothetical protein